MKIGYARVSTGEQHLDLQSKALSDAGCERIFADKASGAKEDRPNLAKALAFLQRDDVLVVWKLDRLGRSLRHLVNIVHELEGRGIGFQVLTGAPIDTTTAAGKLVFGIFASLAEFERALIHERIHAGIKAAKARGVRFGRPVKATPEKLSTARGLIAGGMSVPEAAKHCGLSRPTLYAHLHQ